MPNAPQQTQAKVQLGYLLAVLLILLAPTVFTPLAFAESEGEETRQRLQQLEKDIKRIDWEISEASTRRSVLQRQLRDAEVDMGRLKKNIAQTSKAITDGEAELATLEAQRTDLEKARDSQQQRIKTELRAAWRMGDQGQLKILLNQEDPNTLARAMAYYRYIFAARDTLLQTYRTTLAKLVDIALRVDATLATLSQKSDTLEAQRSELTQAQADREIAVLELNGRINDKGERRKKLQSDREELEKLLRAIEEAVVDLLVPDNFQAFALAKGKMLWPVSGKRSNRFGRFRNTAKMRWQGVTIPTKEGTTVQAIHHGRVVYADWLKGLGLLLIVDHGEGYMSLYTHNSSLLREVGEWVTGGTPVATAGSSGGQNRSALYFEVRHNGKPVDPAKWCTE